MMDGVHVTDAWRLGPRTAGRTRDGSALVASGTYQVTNDVSERLLNALPDIVLVPKAHAPKPAMDFLAYEVGNDGPAQQVLLDRLLDIALVATLRAWFARPGTAAPGWYRAHGDPLAGLAFRLIHEDPAHPWTVAALSARGRRLESRLRAPVHHPGRRTTHDLPDRLAHRARCRPAPCHRPHHPSHRASGRLCQCVSALSVAFKRIRGVSPQRYRAGEGSAAHGWGGAGRRILNPAATRSPTSGVVEALGRPPRDARTVLTEAARVGAWA